MNQMWVETSWLLPIYGLLGVVLALPWSMGFIRRTGPRPAAYLNIAMTLLAFVHGLLVFQAIWNQGSQELIFSWFKFADLHLELAFDISVLNLGALELITFLSLLAQVFALGYMEKDWALARFYSLMGFFEAAMSGLVLSGSLFVSYSLLEMLTLSTYLLVGFWYAQPLVVTAARDAFLTKRIGDVLLLMGVVALAAMAGSLNFNDLYGWVKTESLSPLVGTLLGLALIAGPIGKCAQFPLHLWLDEAMEGPNPASILRNSVVVTCGAYVLIRLQPIVVLSPVTLGVLIALGSITAIGGSLVALAQIDLKRTLSYSTSAYLGLVFVAVGTEWPGVAITLLLTHAVAKALLFMGVGSIITTTTSQNLTEMGGLWSRMPATTLAFVIGSLGMVGILPLGCFWGLRMGADFLSQSSPLLALVFLVVNGLTALNLTRVFRLVFLGQAQPKTRRAPEVPWPMAVPMVSLSIVTLLVPVMMARMSLLPPVEYWNLPVTLLLVAFGVSGVALGSVIPLSKSLSRSRNRPVRILQDLLAYDFYTERLYANTVVAAVGGLSRFSNWFDRYVVDGLVNAVGLASLLGGESLKYSVSGQSQLYLFTIMAGVGLIGVFMTWSLW
ncbi:NAD(P)H-quinone oxidoreductase subunit F [Phormidium sp. FACHB-1136]|jgi:NAD(P)H-quinone oxidoreductase subunit 5|uniref:NAD(P)H-quinone oxidoreductase subunit F n=1 Tax=Phormidium sp. FACHB-1136 TaxID=2692848 RepID=UPI001688F105|nr:NAD(P)H-quinone oxidoreductase subunit F [Phormidium sp. FACHB-1136]MBD2427231.1 NAD(P)H-quinone oxidoreductase subunit F [Phormidium sp. FACHB-1136]